MDYLTMTRDDSFYQEAFNNYYARYKDIIQKRALAFVISTYLFLLALPVSCAFAYYIWEHGAHIK
jgi:hypothetical protein